MNGTYSLDEEDNPNCSVAGTSGGSGGDLDLIYGMHSSTQCNSLGGEVTM